MSLFSGTKIPPQKMGILLAISAGLIFSVQDGVSKYLAENYNVIWVVMFRYWAFAVFVFALSSRQDGGVRKPFRSPQIPLQFFRGVLLVLQVCLVIWCFANIGLINTHVIFASFPLIASALSVLFLGEKVGWQRWLAVICGFIGVIVILRPGSSVFSLQSLLPLLAAASFATYHILTRYVSRKDDSMTSFFWTGIGGVVAISCIGPFFWDPMQNAVDWMWMGALCILGASGHYCTIRALAIAEASSIQPFFFLQLVFATLIGFVFYDETATIYMLIGALIIVSSGLFTFWRESRRAKQAA